MKKTIHIFTVILLLNTFSIFNLQANPPHCEIPCGIYSDSVRITLIYEHIATIEKSMNLINKLSAEEKPDYNQIVRWVMNKEDHAKKIQEIVSQYFLHQRIKIKTSNDPIAYKKYLKQLELLHNISVYTMKSKQSTKLGLIKILQDFVHQFEHTYFGGHKH